VTFINNGTSTTSSTNVTLYHKATGASKMRIKIGERVVVAWQNIRPLGLQCPLGNGSKAIQTQYGGWSAAYFVSGTIQLSNSAPVAVLDYQPSGRISLKISIASLTHECLDPEGDSFTLTGITLHTNNATWRRIRA